ncbi:MAG: AbrB/MazE/SpoVT family DNA-binding domain-containing protein [Acidobacteriota bacterium]
MKVAKWGNSLAVRLPAKLVEALGLKEGDEVTMTAKEGSAIEVSASMTREEALTRLRALRVPMPPDFKFNREELYDRGDREARYLENSADSEKPGAAAD